MWHEACVVAGVTVGFVSAATASTAPASAGSHHWGFAEVLHALNPLQYVPVVGTIYRAVTGDRIPEGLQIMGSLAVGAAISGPIGLVTGIAAIIAEKATGIDPDKVVHRVAVGLGIASDPPVASAGGVVRAADGGPGSAAKAGEDRSIDAGSSAVSLSETETLNQRELDRIRAASLAYARAAALG